MFMTNMMITAVQVAIVVKDDAAGAAASADIINNKGADDDDDGDGFDIWVDPTADELDSNEIVATMTMAWMPNRKLVTLWEQHAAAAGAKVHRTTQQ
jgi:hypothetical protein